MKHIKDLSEILACNDSNIAALWLHRAKQCTLSDDTLEENNNNIRFSLICDDFDQTKSRRPSQLKTYQGTFRTDEQMFEIRTSIVLSKRGHVVENGTISKHCGQSNAVGMH